MSESPNYISGPNPFNLVKPPDFWLRKLHDFDNSLVVIPSKQEYMYRLAQRRKLNLPERTVSDMFKEDSDAKLLASYGLIPVTSIMANPNWDHPYMFKELASRAPWRMGGADAVSDMLDAQDAKDELDRAIRTDDMLGYLGKDAWGLYNKKIGVRSNMYIPKTRSEVVGGKSPAIRIKG